MEKKRSSYTLNSSALDRALSILDKEEQGYQLTSEQRRAFAFLNVAVYAVGITLSIILIAMLFEVLNIFPRFFGGVANFFLYLLYTAGSAITLIIVILFFFNFDLIKQFIRLNRLMETLGLSHAFAAPWKAERKRKKLLNRLTWLLGPFLIVASFILALTPLAGRQFLGMGLSTGIAFIGMHLLRRSKERVDVIEKLQTSLSEYRETAGDEVDSQVNIPQAEYDLLARIERAQIAQDRAQSILASQSEAPDETYLVQRSRAFREARAQLDGTVKWRIQDQVEALTTQPRPEGASEDPDTGVLRLPVLDTSVYIHYKVNDDLRRIKILKLEIDDDASKISSSDG